MVRMGLIIILGMCFLVVGIAGCAKEDDKPAVDSSGTTGTVLIICEGS